jgi:transcriptional regulator with XRE-family HTH domain
MRYTDGNPETPPLERIRRHLAGAEDGWFFAQIADQVTQRRVALELAELVGTTQSSIARLERGGRPPRIDTLRRIADALQCDLRVDLVPRTGPTEE